MRSQREADVSALTPTQCLSLRQGRFLWEGGKGGEGHILYPGMEMTMLLTRPLFRAGPSQAVLVWWKG